MTSQYHSRTFSLQATGTTNECIQHTRMLPDLGEFCLRPSVGYSCSDLNPALQKYEAIELPTLADCTFPVHNDKSRCPASGPNIPTMAPQSRPRHAVSRIDKHEPYPLDHLGSLQYKYLRRSGRLFSLTNFTSLKSSLPAVFKKRKQLVRYR